MADKPDQPSGAEGQQPTAELPGTPPTQELPPTQPAGAQEGAEAQQPAAAEAQQPAPPDQPAQSGADAPPPPPPVVPPDAKAPRRPPHMTKTWIAAVAAGVLLLGGGLGGYFIGAAGDRHGDRFDGRPGWHDPRGPVDGFRGEGPWRGGDHWDR